jgi:CubicO group peptidase (beta-lactamase class C family)
MVKYYTADIDDHRIFTNTEIQTGNSIFYFADSTQSSLGKSINNLRFSNNATLSETLNNDTETTAFLVIKDDAILYERYFEAYTKDSISNIFSVSKSITSLLIGIAIDEDIIDSVDDTITKYIPELNDAAPEFKRLTILHLLNMQSGLDFDENYGNPFDHISKLYYGTNMLKQIKKLHFEHEPGTIHNYQSISTALLGMALERASHKSLAKYLEEKVWIPLEMENQASWSIDDKTNKNTKAFCCLNTTAIDLAKIAKLYLDKGVWKGKRIVSEEWINKSTTANIANDSYQYQWYSNSEDFYALGILGQLIYVCPKDKLIIIRLGKSGMDFHPFLSKIKMLIQNINA